MAFVHSCASHGSCSFVAGTANTSIHTVTSVVVVFTDFILVADWIGADAS